MGTTVQVSCPTCGTGSIPAAAVELRLSSRDATCNHYAFTCPVCTVEVTKPADDAVIRLLSQAPEVRRVHFEPPHMLERKPSACLHPYTEDELLDDLVALAAMPAADVVERVIATVWR